MTNATGLVYIFKAVGLGIFKLDVTTNIKARLNALQTGCPVKIRYVFTTQVINLLGAEAELHKMFRPKREIREWFRLSPHEVNRAIKALQLLNADLIACEYDVSSEDSRLTDNEIASDLYEAIDNVGSSDSNTGKTEESDPLESLLDAVWLCCKRRMSGFLLGVFNAKA